MVTEAVETLQDTILQSHGQMLGVGQLSLLQLGRVQVCSVPEWEHGGWWGWNNDYHQPREDALPRSLPTMKENAVIGRWHGLSSACTFY